MSTSPVLVAAVCAVAGALAGVAAPVVVRRLPEPQLPPEESKPPYAELARWAPLAPVTAAVSGAGSGLVGLRMGLDVAVPVFVYLCVVGTVLGYVDLRVHLLPNAIVLPSYAVVAPYLLLAAVVTGDWDPMAQAAAGGLVLWAAFFLLMVVYPAGMGFGDVKLAGLLGLALGWLGLGQVLVGAFAAFLLGGLTGLGLLLTRRAKRKSAIPFGPFLLLGFLAAVVVGADLQAWYLGA